MPRLLDLDLGNFQFWRAQVSDLDTSSNFLEGQDHLTLTLHNFTEDHAHTTLAFPHTLKVTPTRGINFLRLRPLVVPTFDTGVVVDDNYA